MRPKTPALLGAVLATLTGLLPVDAQTRADPAPIYARIDVGALGPGPLGEVRETPGLSWWVELDDRLLVLAGEPALASLERRLAVERLAVEPRPSRLYLLRGARREDLAAMDVDVLAAPGAAGGRRGRRRWPPRWRRRRGSAARPRSAGSTPAPRG
jgi:hypothetical protein